MIDVRRIPIIGNDMYQVGQVIDIVSSPCTPDPYIAVQAFFYNVPQLVWSLVKPDPVDFVTERFGRPHKRKRRRRMRADDVWIPDSHGSRGDLAWAAWRGIRLVEKVGWYLLVVDATTDFVVNWTSMTYRNSGCPVPSDPWGYIANPNPFTMTDATEWNSMSPAIVEHNGGLDVSTEAVIVPPNTPHTISGHAEFTIEGVTLLPRLPDAVQITATSVFGTYEYDLQKNDLNDPKLGSWSMPIIEPKSPAAIIYRMRYHTTGLGRCILKGWNLQGSAASPLIGLEPDP